MSRPPVEWDTPGGPGGREALARVRGPAPQRGAQALYRRWQEVMDEIAPALVLRTDPPVKFFNTFRRDRIDGGVGDEQLVESFRHFATAVRNNVISVHQGDLWRTYVRTWQRWVHAAPTGAESPLVGRQGSPRRRR